MSDRKIHIIPMRLTTGTKAEKWGVNQRKKVESKLILLSGTGRSGSKTISVWFKRHKIDISHEMTSAYGSSTHFFHSDSEWYPMFPWHSSKAHIGERLSDYNFENHYHIVRNPLTCIPSISKIFPCIDFEFLEDLDMMPMGIKSRLKKCMWVYYSINRKLEDQVGKRNRIKLENLNNLIPLIKKDTGIELRLNTIPHSNRGSGYRRSSPVIWSTLMELDTTLTKNIMKMAKRYGYEV